MNKDKYCCHSKQMPLFSTCSNVIEMCCKDILVLFVLALIGLIMGNSRKTGGELVSWYLNTGNYRPVSLTQCNVTAGTRSIKEELKQGSITNANL